MYLQVNKNCVLNCIRWELIQKDQMQNPSICYVPKVLWPYRNQSVPKRLANMFKSVSYIATSVLDFNNFQVRAGEDAAEVYIHSEKHFFRLHWILSYDISYGFDNISVLDGVRYNYVHNGNVEKHFTTFEGRLEPVCDLAVPKNLRQLTNVAVQVGISSTKFGLMYKGKKLSRTSYAFLYGTWAILVSEKFEFDSLVFLNRVADDVLCIDKIVYSVNPYMVKIMLMIKG